MINIKHTTEAPRRAKSKSIDVRSLLFGTLFLAYYIVMIVVATNIGLEI